MLMFLAVQEPISIAFNKPFLYKECILFYIRKTSPAALIQQWFQETIIQNSWINLLKSDEIYSLINSSKTRILSASAEIKKVSFPSLIPVL